MKDPFSYSARWDSIGLDCSNCKKFFGPDKWPDVKRELKCLHHNVSLEIELREDGYMEWEWFCKEFENKDAFPKAIEELESIKDKLDDKILYRGYGENGQLMEYKINGLKGLPH